MLQILASGGLKKRLYGTLRITMNPEDSTEISVVQTHQTMAKMANLKGLSKHSSYESLKSEVPNSFILGHIAMVTVKGPLFPTC